MTANCGVIDDDVNSSDCFSCVMWRSDAVDTDFGLLGVGVSAVFSRRIQIYAMYDALVGLDHMTSNTVSLGLRGQF